jgi:streptogramin lyase
MCTTCTGASPTFSCTFDASQSSSDCATGYFCAAAGSCSAVTISGTVTGTEVAGIMLTLTGTATASTTTDSSGNYVFNAIPDGSYVVTPGCPALAFTPLSLSVTVASRTSISGQNFVSATAKVAEFAIPTANSYPYGIAAGSDGNLWFTEQVGNISSIIPSSPYTITEFATPTTSQIWGMAAGPDGNLWFTELNVSNIGRIIPSSPYTITEFAIPSGAYAWAIVSGPDGNLLFTEGAANNIGRIIPSSPNTITEFPLPTSGSDPYAGIAAGPDGNLWFTEYSNNKIGRITPSSPNTITEFAIPTGGSGPMGIAAGPDGHMWFTEQNTNKIGRL